MELNIYDKTHTKKSKKVTLNRGMIMVRVTEHEALQLIHSLSEQILRRNPNCGREESYDKDGNYFSVSITEFKKTQAEYDFFLQKKALESRVGTDGIPFSAEIMYTKESTYTKKLNQGLKKKNKNKGK